MHTPKSILIVDDELEILMAVDTTLRMAGFEHVTTISDSRQVLPHIEQQLPGLVLLDLNMPHINGVRLLQMIRETWPRVPVVILTGAIELDTAIACMKLGATDYLVKPVETTKLLTVVNQTFNDADDQATLTEASDLFRRLKHPEAFRHIITQDEQMFSIFHYLEAIGPSRQPVLVLGETGVGKELIGKSIHALSQRKGSLVVVNAAGLDDNVFSDTLFGHVPGAFTGATRMRPGLIEEAAGGTLFLDEIGDLAMTSQVKLLRLLQEGEYLPLGSDRLRHSDARIIAATNQDLWDSESKGTFRTDLLYRLSTHTLKLPPLRNRLEDLPLLIDSFVRQAAEELKKPVPTIPESLVEYLKTQTFRGNIRELKSMLHDAVSRYQKGLLTCDLFMGAHYRETIPGPDIFYEKLPTLKQASQRLVEKALAQTGGNQSAAAKILGISQQALSKRLQKQQAEKPFSS